MALVDHGSEGTPVTRIIAHRGDRAHAPENTMRAFERARQARCDCVELDLQLSADGEVMVFHDDTLEALTGAKGRVRDHTAAELVELHVLPRVHPPDSDSRLCRLSHVLDWAGENLPLYLEIKVPRRDRDHGRELLAATLRAVPAASPHMLASFDPEVVVGALDAGRSAVLIGRRGKDIEALDEGQRDSLHSFSLYFASIDEGLVRRLQPRHFELWAWTVNQKRDFWRLQDLGVEAVCTDDPGHAVIWREEAR